MIIVLWLSLLLFIITYFGIDVIIIVLLFLLLFLLIIIIMTIIVFFNKRLCSFPALVLHPQKMASFIKPRWPLSKTSLMNSYWCSDYSYKIFDFFKEVCLLWIKKKERVLLRNTKRYRPFYSLYRFWVSLARQAQFSRFYENSRLVCKAYSWKFLFYSW